MTYVFKTENFTAEVTVKAVRYLRARISRDGKVLVSAPKGMKRDYVERFLVQQTSWIVAAVNKANTKNTAIAADLEEGGTVFVWGKKYPLILEVGKKLCAVRQEKEVVVTAPLLSADNIVKALKVMYKNELAAAFPTPLSYYAALTGLMPVSVSVRDMATRWGSCTASTKKIRLSLNLAKKPIECLNYILVHELCHIRYPNHQKEFYALVEKFYPNRKTAEKILRA